jgi:hypothetical protein
MKPQKVIRLTAWCIGIMAILACNAVTQLVATPTPIPPTATLTATPTAVPPTSTSTSTAVPPTPTFVVESGILYQEDFSSNANGWKTGKEIKDGGSVEKNVTDGQYVVTLSSTSEYFSALIAVPNFSGKDFVMSMDATILETTMRNIPNGLWLSFDVRSSDPDYYSFAFFMGDFRLIRSKGSKFKDDVLLWDWTTLNDLNLKQGATNTFKFEVNETNFTLYLNDQKIKSATDDTLNESGEVDFIVLLADVNETLTIAFDNLIIQSPE